MLTSCCGTFIIHLLLTDLGLEETELVVLLEEQPVGVKYLHLVPASIYIGGVHNPGGRCRCKVICRVTWMGGGTRRSSLEGRRCRGGRGVLG